MFKHDYENPELKLQCLEELGVNNWAGYSEAMAEYADRVEDDIEKVNEKVDVINSIIMHLDTPQKVANFMFGLVGMVTDPNILVAKLLMTLDDKSLDQLNKDFNEEAREVKE